MDKVRHRTAMGDDVAATSSAEAETPMTESPAVERIIQPLNEINQFETKVDVFPQSCSSSLSVVCA